ncbi:PAS domain-containing protein [Sphingomonas sp. GB1N7]|uniref:PAS domain-containing protein n=1 Tax=Parasphingomonas caseinilytica TaxID=3096158 RepID=UPI002FCBCFA3
MLIGHTWSDSNGILLGVDEPVADLLQRRRRDLEGMSYLAITHPSDRAKSVALVTSLLPGQGPTGMRKRYLTADGAEVWVVLEAARIRAGTSGEHLIGTFIVAGTDQNPRRLWREAKSLLDLNALRGEMLGVDLFADHSWTILLHLYLAEAEGRAADLPELSRLIATSSEVICRWVTALVSRGLVDRDLAKPSVCQLTQRGLETIEVVLAHRSTA